MLAPNSRCFGFPGAEELRAQCPAGGWLEVSVFLIRGQLSAWQLASPGPGIQERTCRKAAKMQDAVSL